MTSRSRRRPFLAIVLAFALLAVACGDDDGGDPQPTDTGQPDTMTTSSSGGEDMNVMPPTGFQRNADSRVLFVYQEPGAASRLYRLESGVDNQALADLVPISSGIDCSIAQCYVTSNERWLVFINNASRDLQVAPFENGSVNAADLVTVETGLSDLRFAGNRLAFTAGNDYYALELDGEVLEIAKRFGPVTQPDPDGTTFSGGGVDMGRYGDKVIVQRINSGQLGVYLADLTTAAESALFRIGVPNPHTGGGWYTNSSAAAVSDDGQRAVLLVEGLDTHALCTDRTECAELGAEGDCHFARSRSNTPSDVGICGVSMKMLMSFRLDSSDLGQTCVDDSECDPAHQCTHDGETLLDTTPGMTCQPRRLVLGPLGSPLSICDRIEEGQFTDIAPKLRFNNEGEVVFLGHSACTDLDISDDAVMAVSADLDPSTLRLIEGRYGHDSGAGFCYDAAEDRWSYQDCAIEIEDFELRPDGNSLVLVGSEPGTNSSGRELWLFDQDDNKYPATNDSSADVTRLQVILP